MEDNPNFAGPTSRKSQCTSETLSRREKEDPSHSRLAEGELVTPSKLERRIEDQNDEGSLVGYQHQGPGDRSLKEED